MAAGRFSTVADQHEWDTSAAESPDGEDPYVVGTVTTASSLEKA